MENDKGFEVDAKVLSRSSNGSLSPSQDGYEGRNASTAADREQETPRHPDHEETPLLSRERSEDYGAGVVAEGDSERASGKDDASPEWTGARDFEGRPWWNKPSILWLLPPFLFFSLAFGGVIVPKINLILTLICREYLCDRSIGDPSFPLMPVILGDNNPQCRIPEVQSLVADFNLYGSLIAGILTAITSPKLGALSDRYGRRKIIALSTSGMLIGEIITIIVAKNPDTLSVKWILLGFACDGLTGSFISAMALTNTYAADCTTPSRRNVTFGYFHAVLFTGIAVGPVLAGYVVKATGQILSVFYFAITAHLVFILFLMFVVPESLTQERQLLAREKYRNREPSKWSLLRMDREESSSTWAFWDFLKHLAKGMNFFAPLKILWPTGEGSSSAVRRNLVLLAAVDTTMFGVAMGSVSVVIIYAEYIFGWGTFETSAFVSAVNVVRVFGLLVVLPGITRVVRGPQGRNPQRNSGSDGLDLAIIRTAIGFDILGYIGYTTVRTGPLLVLSGCLAAFGGLGSPTLSAALTKHVPQDRTGQLLGATGLLHACARVVAPTVFNLIYSKTVGRFTQTVFVCLGSTFGVAFVLSWFVRPHVYFDDPTASKPAATPPLLLPENAEEELATTGM